MYTRGIDGGAYMTNTKDPIVEQIRKYRNQHAAEHGYNLRKIFTDLRHKETLAGHKAVVRRPRLHLRQTGT